MNIALWIVQVLLALAFAGAGLLKISQPIAKLAPNMAWVTHFPAQAVRLIGGVELLGAIGLLVPALTGILPWLTPLAAAGLVVIMIGAVITHIQLHEVPKAVPSLILGLLALFVAYGRFVLPS